MEFYPCDEKYRNELEKDLSSIIMRPLISLYVNMLINDIDKLNNFNKENILPTRKLFLEKLETVASKYYKNPLKIKWIQFIEKKKLFI